MKSSFRFSHDSPSKLDHPLSALAGCILLLASVSMHFYALGAKADPALLAYDESASWQVPQAGTYPVYASASEVLFAPWDFSTLQPAVPQTIQSTAARMHPAPQPGFALGGSTASSTGMEAALLVLNFGY